jgi:hypothetical protein
MAKERIIDILRKDYPGRDWRYEPGSCSWVCHDMEAQGYCGVADADRELFYSYVQVFKVERVPVARISRGTFFSS